MPIDDAVGELVIAAVEVVTEVAMSDDKPRKRSWVRRLVDFTLVVLALGALVFLVYLALR